MLLTSRAGFVRLAAAVLGAALVGTLTVPSPATLGESSTGDAGLAAQVRAIATGEQRVGMSVAVLERGTLRRAGLGDTGTGTHVTPDTPFEIGSVAKTLTASLFADLAADGVVRPGEAVREVLPGRDWQRGGGADATLAELAGQRSGLPRMPLTPWMFLGGAAYTFLGINPDPGTPEDVLDAADEASRSGVGEFAYSNLGFAFLGHVLAEKTGRPYPELLRARVLGPLNLRSTVIPGTTDGIPRGAAEGHDGSGRHVAPAVSDGDAPAGAGVWSTTADLARFAERVMRGTAPGASAAEPRYPAGEDRIGYAWYTTRTGDRSVVWHNGQSGGCTAFLGFDRANERVVVVLNNTDVNVDSIGMRLLTGSGGEADAASQPAAVLIGAGLPPLAGLSLLGACLGGWRRAKRRVPDRAGILGNGGWTLLGFAAAYAAGALDAFTVAGWLAGAAVVGVAVFVAGARWRELGWNTAARPRLHWAGSALGMLLGVAAAIVVGG